MAIAALRIKDFRNLLAVDINPHPSGLNIIYGDNGSGKTSLLEAIYYLSFGRSFRSSVSSSIIRHAASKFSLFAQLIHHNETTTPVGIERDLDGLLRLRLAEKDIAAISELAVLLPIRMINSFSFQLFESGPSLRRKYLDWGLFYQDDKFFTCWRSFERLLKQRNLVLKAKKPKKEIEIWSLELAKYASELNQFRREYLSNLIPFVNEIACELLDFSNLKLSYWPGWSEGIEYTQILDQHLSEDLRLGYTSMGPHRADLEITINDLPVKHFLSRGQQKLLICAMILGQGKLLSNQVNKAVIYLLDDLPAELDAQSKNRLISVLSKQKTQMFITAIDTQMVYDIKNDFQVPTKVFHVKHGQINLEEEMKILGGISE
jgi:DNA replication and repair protein RecF